jgi:hypothetical protein
MSGIFFLQFLHLEKKYSKKNLGEKGGSFAMLSEPCQYSFSLISYLPLDVISFGG